MMYWFQFSLTTLWQPSIFHRNTNHKHPRKKAYKKFPSHAARLGSQQRGKQVLLYLHCLAFFHATSPGSSPMTDRPTDRPTECGRELDPCVACGSWSEHVHHFVFWSRAADVFIRLIFLFLLEATRMVRNWDVQSPGWRRACVSNFKLCNFFLVLPELPY